MEEEKKNVENVQENIQGNVQKVNRRNSIKKTPKTHENMFAGGGTD